jgi:phosphoribulokinase
MPDKQMVIQRTVGRNGSASVRPIMLAIAGDSAAGKTTLTRGLVEALSPERITRVCVDDYHRYDRAERRVLPFTPLHPACNYLEIMEQHLQLLSLGQPILKPVYNHADGSLGRPVLIEPRQFIVVEGLFPLYSKLARACSDITVYLDPPEPLRRKWKLRRDTTQRGYAKDEVLRELDRREVDSVEHIRPQRAHADIVVRFSPIEERGEGADSPPSATVLLRPTIRHPDLSSILGDDTRQALHLKLLRDDDGKPVDALHVHNYASPATVRKVAEAIWAELAVAEPLPESLGEIEPGNLSPALALTQLILLFHLFQGQRG